MSVAHAPSCPVSLAEPPKCTCALKNASVFRGNVVPNHADDCPRHCTCDFGRRLREFFHIEPSAKTRLKIVATLGNSMHMDAEKIHAMESEVISVLEKHGLKIHQEERDGIDYVSILTFFEPLP